MDTRESKGAVPPESLGRSDSLVVDIGVVGGFAMVSAAGRLDPKLARGPGSQGAKYDVIIGGLAHPSAVGFKPRSGPGAGPGTVPTDRPNSLVRWLRH